MGKINAINNNGYLFFINYFNNLTFDIEKINYVKHELNQILINHIIKHKLLNQIQSFIDLKRKKTCFCCKTFDQYLGDYLSNTILLIINNKNKNAATLTLFNQLNSFILKNDNLCNITNN
jgi:hypothetical protein